MAATIPKKCPSCALDMHVRLLRCPACGTEVQGDFLPGRFAQLSEEQIDFLETFIRCRGSLKDLGAAINISYPTARNRLDNLIVAMGFENTKNAGAARLEILAQLKDGIITAEEALYLLQGGKENE